jgi:AhpD family alkylhydroperoxidase
LIKYISPINRKTLNPELVRQIKREFGDLVEPLSLHTPVPELLVCAWSALRESLIAGTIDRELKEAVASAVSISNQCPYCVDAHTLMLHGLARHDTAKAIAENRMDDIRDENLRAHIKWAGATNDPDSPIIAAPPFSKGDAPEIIAVVFVFQYINRMVSSLLSESPLPMGNSPLKGIMKRVGALMFSKALKVDATRGESFKFNSESAALPDDMLWAKGNAYVDRAMAAWAYMIEEKSKHLISTEVLNILETYLLNWKGESPGLDPTWLSDAVKGHDEKTQTMASLALMAAVAPYRVDETTVQNFQRYFPDDDQLIITLSWASFSAARKIAGWLMSEKS